MLHTKRNSQLPLQVSVTLSRLTQQANVAQAEPQEKWRLHTQITLQVFQMIGQNK